MNNKYLVGFSVSPVQSFILQSRKTQDLYNASRFLSLVSEKILNDLKSVGASIVFPYVGEDVNKKTSGVPNRILAILEEDDEKIDELLKTIKSNSSKFIREQGERVLDKVFSGANWKDTYMKDIFTRQISNYFDVSYAAIRMDDNYEKTYEELENIMSALKLSRLFEQTKEEGIKCNLCGEREVLHFDKFSGSIRDMRKSLMRTSKKIAVDMRYLFKENENLCSIGTLKRAIHKINSDNFIDGFPSTADVALSNVLNGNIKEVKDYESELNKFINKFFGIRNENSELFYSENLTENYFIKNFGTKKQSLSGDEIKNLCNHNKKLRKALKKQNIHLQKYYAVLMLDGDHMGKWMSGEYAGEENDLKKVQSAISKKLLEFNKKIYSYFNEHKEYGTLVYAGGDDVLAFVNINKIFDVIKDIKKMYPESFVSGETEKPTCSIGVCIAHYKEPLSIVMDKAREMEKKAKEEGGRDTFAFAVINKSGNYNEFVAKNGQWDGLDALKYFVDSIIDNKLSTNFIYTFVEEVEPVFADKNRINNFAKYQEEFYRLINRSIKTEDMYNDMLSNFREKFKFSFFKGDIISALRVVSSIAKIQKGDGHNG